MSDAQPVSSRSTVLGIFFRLAQSGVGIFASLLGTIVIFLLVARLTGPAEFGLFALSHAICSLFGVLFDFGYQSRLLKETAELIASRGGFPARIFYLKIALFLLLTPAAVFATYISGASLFLFPAFWAGISMLSIGNLLSASLKSINLHGRDSIHALIANLFGLVVIIVVALSNVEGVFYYVFAFPVIGMVYLGLTVPLWLRTFHIVPEQFRFHTLLLEFRTGFAFALDALTQRGFNFISVAILSFFTSYAALGLFQAGQKIAQGFLPLAQPFNNVMLPRLAHANSNLSKWNRAAAFTLTAMLILGVVSGGFVILFGDWIADILFGGEYDKLKSFLWLFGIVIALRFFGSALAIIITSLGMQTYRALTNLVSLGLFIIYAPLLSSAYGAMGGVIAIVIAAAFIGIAYTIIMIFSVRRTH